MQIKIQAFQSTLPVGGATTAWIIMSRYTKFQSTLPVGGATFALIDASGNTYNFNPRSPWGERLDSFERKTLEPLFQSTLPVGGATVSQISGSGFTIFQSTLPVGGATVGYRRTCNAACNFNPRSPWGERHIIIAVHKRYFKFQSTLPVGGATERFFSSFLAKIISIHAPRGGSDFWKMRAI